MIFRDKIDVLATGEAFAKKMEKSAEAVARRLVETQQQAFQQREQAYQDQIRALTAAVTALTQQQAQPDPPPGIHEALIQLAQGKLEAAEAIFQSVVTRRASDIDEAATALRHLGALAFLHDTTKLLQAYRRAVELDPDNAEGWTQLGHLLVRTGQVDHAADAFRKVLTRGAETSDDSLLASAYGNLGIVYQIRGDLDQAEAMHRRALELFQEIRGAPQIEKVQNLLDALRA
jgi:tetratricopeptide (TPR) repeat protein